MVGTQPGLAFFYRQSPDGVFTMNFNGFIPLPRKMMGFGFGPLALVGCGPILPPGGSRNAGPNPVNPGFIFKLTIGKDQAS